MFNFTVYLMKTITVKGNPYVPVSERVLHLATSYTNRYSLHAYGLALDLNPHPALRGELGRVRHEVGQTLANPQRVTVDGPVEDRIHVEMDGDVAPDELRRLLAR